MQSGDLFYRYWGKARPAGEAGSNYHLLVYHSLDVAAVGAVLLANQPTLAHRLSQLAGIQDTAEFTHWATFFLALHDLGKFSQSFQNLCPELLQTLQGKVSQHSYTERHDSLGFLLWQQKLKPQFQQWGLVNAPASPRRAANPTIADLWMAVVTGHHGKPPKVDPCLLRDAFDPIVDTNAAFAYVAQLMPLLLGKYKQPLAGPTAQFRIASWWLAGFSVLCDWLGSNQTWFPYCDRQQPLAEYWIYAQKQAACALHESGVVAITPSKTLSLHQLLRLDKHDNATPTPLQAFSQQIPLATSSQLIIMEDVTGAGKTEAALLLAHRMMAKCGASGLYIGLPTMATANGIYRRLAPVLAAFFDPQSSPSLVLAHGARDMDAQFRQSIIPRSEERPYGDETEPAAAWCRQWLADNTKKALLADMGVGTIDQSLLGILPSKYQSLRLFGLLGKVLIVDEVHACDAYMHKLLGYLLTFHAASGGSAILLSATLSQSQRQSLLGYFAQGLAGAEDAEIKVERNNYPLFTHYSIQGLRQQPLVTREEVCRKVKVTLLSDFISLAQRISQALLAGACVCWIRNTVPEARAAWHWLKKRHSDWNISLFHARYSLADRMRIENDVLTRFGANSSSQDRQGRFLIATQVVEQSLDLDFDLMISDLAPIDLIIQRAGRLQRHTRDIAGNRIKGQDLRGMPELLLYGPKYTETPTANWLPSLLPGTSAIYGHHGQLWLTVKWLHAHGGFRMPEDARDMIESVYSDEVQADIPEGLLGASLTSEGTESAEASLAASYGLKLTAGYQDVAINQWWEEANTPTRLGEATTLVFLARWEAGQLLPFRAMKDFIWQQNSLRIRTYHLASEARVADIPWALIQETKVLLPGKGKWGVLLPLCLNARGQWQGQANNEQGQAKSFIYDSKLGLLTENDYNEENNG